MDRKVTLAQVQQTLEAPMLVEFGLSAALTDLIMTKLDQLLRAEGPTTEENSKDFYARPKPITHIWSPYAQRSDWPSPAPKIELQIYCDAAGITPVELRTRPYVTHLILLGEDIEELSCMYDGIVRSGLTVRILEMFVRNIRGKQDIYRLEQGPFKTYKAMPIVGSILSALERILSICQASKPWKRGAAVNYIHRSRKRLLESSERSAATVRPPSTNHKRPRDNNDRNSASALFLSLWEEAKRNAENPGPSHLRTPSPIEKRESDRPKNSTPAATGKAAQNSTEAELRDRVKAARKNGDEEAEKNIKPELKKRRVSHI